MDPFEETWIATNGVRLHTILAGPPQGPLVILLHGFPEFWRGWIHQIGPLAQAGFRVAVPDQRGYNLSDVPRGVEAYRLETLTADICGLADALGRREFMLAGHDWGALVAWSTALTVPGRVRRLAILNVPHPAVMSSFLRKDPRQMLKSWYIAFFQIPLLAEWLLERREFGGALAMLRASGKAGTFTSQDLEAARQAYRNSGGLRGMIHWYRALARYRPTVSGNLRLRMPVRILWGKQDSALRFEMAQASLEYCDDGRLTLYEQATHWVQHDEAQAVHEELIRFFSAQDAQPAAN